MTDTKRPDWNLQTIVADWLREHGYDGLCGDGCGCGVDDLMPCVQCETPIVDCKPGYRCDKERKARCEAEGVECTIDWDGAAESVMCTLAGPIRKGEVMSGANATLFGEPWAARHGTLGSTVVCGVHGEILVSGPKHESFAERIVACFNACAGMADPQAEIDRLREHNALLRAECQAWRASDATT